MGSAVFKVEGFDEIERYFERATAFQKADFAEFVGGESKAVTEQSFADQKDPVTGTPWPALSPVTLARKRGGLKLIERGQMKNSIGYEAYPDGSVLIGSNKVYSRIHQEGGKAGRGLKVQIPQRRFLGTDPQFFTRVFEDGAVRELLGVED
jgi:phage virion morphogenesis (putative tail completion) protein